MNLSNQSAAGPLSEYLSMLFRAEIHIPVMPIDRVSDISFRSFFQHLPKVVQRAVDGAELKFQLPLVQGSKGTSISPQVAQVINCLLQESSLTSPIVACEPFDVPTFFYGDGSTMVITFDMIELSGAMMIMVLNPLVGDFISNALKARS